MSALFFFFCLRRIARLALLSVWANLLLLWAERFGPFQQIRDSIVVSISACRADDPGSIPGRGAFLCFLPRFSAQFLEMRTIRRETRGGVWLSQRGCSGRSGTIFAPQASSALRPAQPPGQLFFPLILAAWVRFSPSSGLGLELFELGFPRFFFIFGAF